MKESSRLLRKVASVVAVLLSVAVAPTYPQGIAPASTSQSVAPQASGAAAPSTPSSQTATSPGGSPPQANAPSGASGCVLTAPGPTIPLTLAQTSTAIPTAAPAAPQPSGSQSASGPTGTGSQGSNTTGGNPSGPSGQNPNQAGGSPSGTSAIVSIPGGSVTISLNPSATASNAKSALTDIGLVDYSLPPTDSKSKTQMNNAVDISGQLAGVIPQVIGIIPVSNSELVFLVDLSPKSDGTVPKLSEVQSNIEKLAKPLAAYRTSAAGNSQGKPTQVAVYVKELSFFHPSQNTPPYLAPTPDGPHARFNNASDIASALSGWPQVIGVTAVTDSKLVFVLDVSPKSGSAVPQDPGPLESAIDTAVSSLQTFKYPLAAHWISVPVNPERGNASDIASKLATNSIPGILSIIPVENSKILFLLDETQDPRFPTKPRDIPAIERELNDAVTSLEAGFPTFYVVPFPLATGKNCDVANALVRQIPGVMTIAAVGTTRLAFTIDPSITGDRLDRIEHEIDYAVKSLAEPNTTLIANPRSYAQRLYYDHDPTTLASILNNAFPEVKASAIGTDTIVLSESLPDPEVLKAQHKTDPLVAARRVISLVDQPKPQVSLEMWSLQLSTTKKEDMDAAGPLIQTVANHYGEAIANSLASGWRYLVGKLGRDDSGFLDPQFSDYLTRRVLAGRQCCYTVKGEEESKDQGYALGFTALFRPLPPNLVYMLLAIVASRQPRTNADQILNVMETGKPENTPPSRISSTALCTDRDRSVYEPDPDSHAVPPPPDYLQLECVRDVLDKELFATEVAQAGGGTSGTSSIGEFRAAVADFMFQYKMMNEYPGDFQPFLASQAGAVLDAQINPIVQAFDMDLEVFDQEIQKQIVENRDLLKRKGVTYAASGVVSVKVVAGNQASVQTTTQNYFDATPPATLGDLAAAIKSIGSPTNSSTGTSIPPVLPTLLTANMTANEAVGTLAALQVLNRAPVIAKIGKGLTLTATAYSLSGAAGAEMDITAESNENGAEQLTAATASNESSTNIVNDDMASRVSDHKVSTRVRLNSLNLFNLSTMQSVLARGKTPWKPFDPLEVPLLGELVKVPRDPDITYHRSFIFINALIVPTASDLGGGTAYSNDLIPDKEHPGMWTEARSFEDLGTVEEVGRIRQFHHAFVDWLASQYIDVNGNVQSRDEVPKFRGVRSVSFAQ